MAGIDTPAGYTRLERTGTTADAGVYRAWDERGRRWVVLRLFHRYVADHPEEAAFAAYVTTSIGLGRNAAIVPVRAGGVTATGRPWLALDPVDARPFSDILRDDPPSPAAALDLTIVLADALAWARPMTHGRIRAESVLVGASGRPMITDFSAPRPPGSPPPTQRGDVTNLAALLFRAVTGGPWPGRGLEDDYLIARWPGLTGLFDEVLTPVPALDTMTEFAARLRQVRQRAGAMVPPVAAPGPAIVAETVVTAVPAAPVPLPPAGEPGPVTDPRGRRLPVLTAALMLVPIGFGVVQLFPGRAGDAAEPVAPIPAVRPPAPPTCPPVAPAAPPAASPGGDERPALWWPADEGAGRTVCDHSGAGNEATLGPRAGWSASGAAMRFDSTTADSFASGTTPAVRTDRSFTVMAWVNLGDTDRPHGVISQPGASTSGFILKYEKLTDSWRLTMPRADTLSPRVDGPSSSSRPRTDTWTHLAATFDAEHGEITIYVDGVAEDTVRHTASWTATGPVQVGRTWWDGAWTDRFPGLIDDVRAYQAEISPDGITEIARTGRADHPAGH